MSKNQSSKPLEIKISTVVAVSVILYETALSVLDDELKAMTGGVSDYFDNEFAVIDVAGCDLAAGRIDWPALIRLFKKYSLNPVAVRNAPPEAEAGIIANGLSIDIVAQPRQHAESEPEPAVAVKAPEAVPAPPPPVQLAAPPTMVIDTPVRAGQRIYARGSDLIVMAVVNNGAELIADGNIHVYAPLRGRALAGASGDASARIFTLSMEAELVSIAGTYRTFENGLPQETAKKPTQIRLAGDRIDVLSIHA